MDFLIAFVVSLLITILILLSIVSFSFFRSHSLHDSKTFNLSGQSYWFRPYDLGYRGVMIINLPGIYDGDFLLLRGKNQNTVRYEVTTTKCICSSRNLYHLSVEFQDDSKVDSISFNSENETALKEDWKD